MDGKSPASVSGTCIILHDETTGEAHRDVVKERVRSGTGRGRFILAAWLQGFGPAGLFLLSFAHDLFSPVPPEVLLLPLGLGAPQTAFWLALLATLGSLAGGLVGYGLGTLLGRPVLVRWFGAQRLGRAEAMLTRYDVLAVLLATFTPLPFKLITIPAGVLRVGLLRFLLVAGFARGLRFFLEAAVLYWLGPGMVQAVFDHLLLLGVLALVAGAAAWYLVRRRQVAGR